MFTVNMDKRDSEYVLSLKAPSVPDDNFDIELDDHQINIMVLFKDRDGANNEEFPFSVPMFTRTLPLPKYVDLEGIEAVHRDDTLFIIMPRIQFSDDMRRLIPVRTDG